MKHICQALRIPGMFVDEYIHVGSGTLEGDVVINISKTKQDPSAFYRGVYGNATIGLSGNSATAIAEGGRLEGKITSAFNLSSADYGLRGGTFIATHAGTGTITAAVGGLSLVQNQNVGTVTTGFSHIIASGDNSGGGTLTNLVGIAVANQSLGTNNTLLLMGTLTPLSSNYAIYSASTYQSLFAGNITANAIIKSNRQNIQTTTTQGMAVANDEASTVGVTDQWSPGLDFIGHAWRTAATDRYIRFRLETQTTSGASPSGTFVIKSSVDTGAESWTNRLTLTTAGALTVQSVTASGLTITRVPFASTAGLLIDDAAFTYTVGTGQLALATTGSGAGILIGGDTQLYRSAADTITIPDYLTVAGPTSTVTSGSVINLASNVTANPGSATSASYYALSFNTTLNSNQNYTGTCSLFDGTMTHGGSGTITLMQGMNATLTSSSTGTITTSRAAAFRLHNASSGATVTTAQGVYIVSPRCSSAGTVTTAAMIYFDSNTVSGSGVVTNLRGIDLWATSAMSAITANSQVRVGIDIGAMPSPGAFTGTTSVALRFASGTTARDGILWGTDTTLYRSAADTLKTDDSFVVGVNLTLGTKGSYTESTGQLALTTSGSGAGILLGGDANIYRSAANMLKTDDGLTVALAFNSGVVTLTDGATPALDASQGNTFLLTAAGNRTIAVPTNPVSGQKITIVHKASGADRTLALNTGAGGFRYGTDITALTATTSAKTDYIGAIYNAADNFWDVVSAVKGY